MQPLTRNTLILTGLIVFVFIVCAVTTNRNRQDLIRFNQDIIGLQEGFYTLTDYGVSPTIVKLIKLNTDSLVVAHKRIHTNKNVLASTTELTNANTQSVNALLEATLDLYDTETYCRESIIILKEAVSRLFEDKIKRESEA